jgi:hypothetical protein
MMARECRLTTIVANVISAGHRSRRGADRARVLAGSSWCTNTGLGG